MKSAVVNGTSTTYVYNALGQRVEKTVGSTSTGMLYDAFGKLMEYNNLRGETEDVFWLGNRPLAIYVSGTRFLHPNALGSTGVATDQNGSETQDEIYYPWGQRWTVVGATDDERFASLGKRDAESGLDPTQFRMFSSNLGRWLSPDPLAGHITNPQSLNRYAYVLNNPTSLIDPLGLHWECVTSSIDGVSHTSCTWVPDPAPVPEPVNPCALVSPGAYTGPPSCSIIYPTGDPGPMGPTGPGNTGSGSGTGTASANAAAVQAATQSCQNGGQLAFKIPFVNIPVTFSLSATFAVVNYSTTNDITPVIPALPIPPFVSFGVGFDWTFNAPANYAYNLSVGAGKNASVGSYYLGQGKGWQGLSLSAGESIGPPVMVSPPPANNACGMLASKSGG